MGARVGEHTRAERLGVELEHLQAAGEWARKDQVVSPDALRVQLADARAERLALACQRLAIAPIARTRRETEDRLVELAPALN